MIKQISALGLVAALALSTAACTDNQKRYGMWGGGGAALGALAGQAIGGDTKGTLIGAAIGGAGGSLIAHEKNKKHNNHSARHCTYRNSKGQTYRAPCTQ